MLVSLRGDCGTDERGGNSVSGSSNEERDGSDWFAVDLVDDSGNFDSFFVVVRPGGASCLDFDRPCLDCFSFDCSAVFVVLLAFLVCRGCLVCWMAEDSLREGDAPAEIFLLSFLSCKLPLLERKLNVVCSAIDFEGRFLGVDFTLPIFDVDSSKLGTSLLVSSLRRAGIIGKILVTMVLSQTKS